MSKEAMTLALEASKDLCTEFALAKVRGILEEALAKQEQGKSVIGMLEPIGILMKLEGDKHLKIYGMDEQLKQQTVATEEKWDGVLHKGIIHSEKLITPQPKQEQGDPVAVKRMLEWAEALKRLSDQGQYMNIPSELSAGTCYQIGVDIEQFCKCCKCDGLATTPPQKSWVSLTEKEQDAIFKTFSRSDAYKRDFLNRIANAVEAKLQEKNSG